MSSFRAIPGESFLLSTHGAAILLIGGNKRGDKRWYKKHLPIADERFRRHLERLKQEE